MENSTTIESLSEIGKRLKAVRKLLGLTQAELAEQIGMSRGTLIAWEQGNISARSSPSLEALKSFLAMGFSVNWILAGVEPMRLSLFDLLEPILKETDHAPEPAPEPDDSPSAAAPTGAAQEVLDDRDSSPTGRDCLALCRGGCSVPAEPAAIRIVIEIPGGGGN